MFCIKSFINLDGSWFIQILCVITDPIATLDDIRDIVIRINNNRIKRNQKSVTSKVYIVYVTKL